MQRGCKKERGGSKMAKNIMIRAVYPQGVVPRLGKDREFTEEREGSYLARQGDLMLWPAVSGGDFPWVREERGEAIEPGEHEIREGKKQERSDKS